MDYAILIVILEVMASIFCLLASFYGKKGNYQAATLNIGWACFMLLGALILK